MRERIIDYVNALTYPGIMLLILISAAFPAVRELLGFDPVLIPLIILGGHLLYSTVKATIQTKRITAGVLVVIAMIATLFIEDYLAGAIVGLMMVIGEALEGMTLEKTRNAVRELIKLTPSVASVLRNGQWVQVALGEVQRGDTVLVRPGERVPVDGRIIAGSAAVDESSIKGESMPADKLEGAKVFAGSMCVTGALEVFVEKVGADTTFGQIIRVIKEAQMNKGATQKFADMFAGYFTPVVLLLAVAVYLLTGELVRAITILVIACPCALVLATPTAVVAGVGNAAKRGALIKGGVTLEQTGRITAVLFDKTGTLTKGTPAVKSIEAFAGFSEEQVLRFAAAAEQKSEHPIAKAILRKAAADGIVLEPAQDFVMEIGRGVSAVVGTSKVSVGNTRLLKDMTTSVAVRSAAEAQESLGRTALLVVVDGQVAGCLAVADTIREDAPQMIALLRQSGIKTIAMLTGDNKSVAAAIAKEVGITEFRAGLLPQEKLDVVREYQAKKEVVAMVGDGVNDGPSLVIADVGVAMGAMGTDVAIEAADIALMGDNLLLIPEMLGLSKAALKVIQQNIWVFAVAVNVVGMAFGSLGEMTPIQAAIVHNVASVAVVVNSARLLSYRQAAF